MDDDAVMDAQDAASLLKVRPGTVYDWAARGVLPHIRILAGKRRPVIRFRRADLDRFLHEKSVRVRGQ
jgi:excisionase family DNA binding protein